MEDQELERLAKGLGARAERQLDVDGVAERVVQRLRSDGPQSGHGPVRRLGKRTVRRAIQIAAVFIVVVTGGLMMRNSRMTRNVAPEFAVPLALDDLTEEDLTDVLDSLEFDAPVQHVGRGGIDDLSETELEELLAMMES